MRIIESGIADAQRHMDCDLELLKGFSSEDSPLLHLYDWPGDVITYGYFINPSQFLDITRLQTEGIQLARRPTGGGITFHFGDISFSLFIPASHPNYSTNTLNNYGFIHAKIAEEMVKRGLKPEIYQKKGHPEAQLFCLGGFSQYDLLIEGRKIAGGAQRRTRQGFLHQGTISLGPLPNEKLSKILLSGRQSSIYHYNHGFINCNKESIKQILKNLF